VRAICKCVRRKSGIKLTINRQSCALNGVENVPCAMRGREICIFFCEAFPLSLMGHAGHERRSAFSLWCFLETYL
jgi:hypothetical protein